MAADIPSLRKALEASMRELGLHQRLQIEQIAVQWPKIVGLAVAKISSPTHYRHGTLFIEVVDNIWMQELKFQEGELISRVNAALGEPLVRRLFLQLARTPALMPTPPAEAEPAHPATPPLSPQQELALEREVANVRDPQLREILKDFRRRLLQTRPASSE